MRRRATAQLRCLVEKESWTTQDQFDLREAVRILLEHTEHAPLVVLDELSLEASKQITADNIRTAVSRDMRLFRQLG
jgi:hypothetical protein